MRNTRRLTRPLIVAAALAATAACDGQAPTDLRSDASRASVQARSAIAPSADPALVNGSELQWGPAPPCFPAGAQLAVVYGNPFAAGELFTVRLRMPNDYVVDPHWHPSTEHVTVLQGTLEYATGETFDEDALTAYGRDGYFAAEAGVPHYVRARGETEIQVHAVGPFALVYVNEGDTPSCPVP